MDHELIAQLSSNVSQLARAQSGLENRIKSAQSDLERYVIEKQKLDAAMDDELLRLKAVLQGERDPGAKVKWPTSTISFYGGSKDAVPPT